MVLSSLSSFLAVLALGLTSQLALLQPSHAFAPSAPSDHARGAQHKNNRLRVAMSSAVMDPSSSSSATTADVTAVTAATAVAHTPDKKDPNNERVEFPPPLSKVDRLRRATTFWSTALPIVLSYYGLISRLKLQQVLRGEKLSETEEEELWNKLHATGAEKLAETITSLSGFYVKTAQIISSRQDLFPPEYTDALSIFTDNVDPMPVALVKAVITSELLHQDETFDSVFAEFDDQPLGAASVAQVHRAVLTEKYGGREVAVKVQRPAIESKLMGDIANLKALAKNFRTESPFLGLKLPLDYYTVFCELELQLQDEFDFVAEAVAMDRIYQSLVRAPDGTAREVPLVVPRPVPGLVSRRVLVQDFLHGV